MFHVKPERQALLQEWGVSRETERKLETFAALLLRWSRTINLIGRADAAAVWQRHILDSLQLLPFLFGREPPAIDLGSGGGFPGLVLALAADWPFHLIEADHRKAAFLREVARDLKAPVTVHAARIEAVSLSPASLITARGLAPLPKLLAWAAPFVAPRGVCLFLKGRMAEQELTQAQAQWHMRVMRVPSRTDPAATLLHISELRRVSSGH